MLLLCSQCSDSRKGACELFIKEICLKTPHLCNVSINQSPQVLPHDCGVPHHSCGPILWTIHHFLVPKSSIQDMVKDLSILLHPSCSHTFPLGLQVMTSHDGETKDLVIKDHSNGEFIGDLFLGNSYRSPSNLKTHQLCQQQHGC